MNVLLPKQFNVEKIKYSEMKVMKSGAKSVYVNYMGSKINIQTPVLNIPYGVNDNSQFIKEDSRKDEVQKFDITVSFKGIEENPKIKLFHDKLIELENKIMEDAFVNRVAWFKNNFEGNKGTVSNMFSRIIRRDKDKDTGMYADKYPPTFKAKIPYNSVEDRFDLDTYDMDNNEIDFKEYVSNLKGGKAQFIIQLNGIWFSAGMFGCSWKIVSGKFQKVNSSKLTFVKDSDDENCDDDDDDIDVDTEVVSKQLQKASPSNVTKPSVTKETAKPVVVKKEEPEEEDEEEEEEEEEEDEEDEKVEEKEEEDDEEEEEPVVPEPEPEPEPEPVKVVAKKVSKKKT